MGIINKQIGWSNESNLLWNILNQLNKLTKVTGSISFNEPVAPTVEQFTLSGISTVNLDNNPVTPNQYVEIDGVMYGPYNIYASPLISNTIRQPLLTSITFNGEGISSLTVPSIYSALTSLSFPNLVVCYGSNSGTVNLSNLSSLVIFSAPLLKWCDIFTMTNLASLTTLNVDSLIRTGNINMNSLTLFTSISFPALKSVSGSINISSLPAITSIITPSLEYIGGNVGITLLSVSLTSITLPVIKILGSDFNITNCTGLTSFSFGSGLFFVNGNVVLSGCALNQASIDDILVKLAALDGTGGTIIYSNKTVNLSGGTNTTPSAIGLAAKVILVGRGCTVTNN
jgi:hypothetical protein